MRAHYEAAGVTLFHGDCLDVLRELPDESVHAVVTDPPYGIAFMGKQWDQPGEFGSTRSIGTPGVHRRGATRTDDQIGDTGAMEAGRYDLSPSAMHNFQRWCEAWARECYRVLKPGGLSFGGSRTWHRLAAGVEDAGFEMRDSIAWLYGSGFPKSLDVAKAIDKAAGFVGEVVGHETVDVGMQGGNMHTGRDRNLAEREVRALSPTAEAWDGWGTALKPSFEPIVVARKPLVGTVAKTVLAHRTGALNIDATRVPMNANDRDQARVPMRAASPAKAGTPAERAGEYFAPAPGGRHTPNVVLDESQAASLDDQTGELSSGMMRSGQRVQSSGGDIYGRRGEFVTSGATYGDSGGASRFFPTFRYEAKAPTSERPVVDGVQHPTVKPLELMQWLVRLVTPKGGTVLEPFAGSGTTVEACLREGFDVIAIERESDYLPLIEKRIRKDHAQGLDFDWGEAS